MNYSFIDMCDASIEEKYKVFDFCLSRASTMTLPHLAMSQASKGEIGYLLDKDIEVYNNRAYTCTNLTQLSSEDLEALLAKEIALTDGYYLELESTFNIDSLKALRDLAYYSGFTKVQTIAGEKDVYVIYGYYSDEVNRILIDFINENIRQEKVGWQLNLIDAKHMGMKASIYGNSASLSNVDEYFLQQYPDVFERETSFDSLTLTIALITSQSDSFKALLSFFIVNCFNNCISSPYTANLCIANREALFIDGTRFFVCLTDNEIMQINREYNVDLTKFKLLHRQSKYCDLFDCFSIKRYIEAKT